MTLDASADADAVRAVEVAWDRLCQPLSPEDRSRFEKLLADWEPVRAQDPIVIDVDLLSPLGRELKETSHTQALAWLLDPRATHGLGDVALLNFLDYVEALLPDDEDRRQFAAATESVSDAGVLVERAAIGAGARADEEELSVSRTDLWLELPAVQPRALVVVEAKIDTAASVGQLARYDELIADRLRSLNGDPVVVKVYLTPWGAAPPTDSGGRDWRCGDMFTMAAYLRAGLDDQRGPGGEYLRLYLATVLQKVLDLRWSDRKARTWERLLFAYLSLSRGG